jgi:predicted DNA-binding protein (MmcQ/YjbR family)
LLFLKIIETINNKEFMTIETLQAICEKLPGVTQDIKWGNHLCFNVGEKMFLVTNPDEVPHTATFKVNDEDFEELSQRKGFKPAPTWQGINGYT